MNRIILIIVVILGIALEINAQSNPPITVTDGTNTKTQPSKLVFPSISVVGSTVTIGGGSGTVTDVTGTSPIASTGGTAPAISCSTCLTSADKDSTGGYAGLTLFKIDFKNAANTFTSFFSNANSAARTYTFQNRDGTIADDTDLAGKQNSLGFTAENSANKVTAFSSPTDVQYPSAKLVSDQIVLRAPLASPAFTGTPTSPTFTFNGAAGVNFTSALTGVPLIRYIPSVLTYGNTSIMVSESTNTNSSRKNNILTIGHNSGSDAVAGVSSMALTMESYWNPGSNVEQQEIYFTVGDGNSHGGRPFNIRYQLATDMVEVSTDADLFSFHDRNVVTHTTVDGLSGIQLKAAGQRLSKNVADEDFIMQAGASLISYQNSNIQIGGTGSTPVKFTGDGIVNFGSKTLTGAGDQVQIRNGTNEQWLYLYKTYTNNSNFAALHFKWAGNDAEIGTEVGSSGTLGDLIFTRGGSIERFAVTNGGLRIADGMNVALATTTGTQLGTGTTQKLGLWGTTPIIQPANTVAIDTLLSSTGLRASGGIANFDGNIKGAVGVAIGQAAGSYTPGTGQLFLTDGSVAKAIVIGNGGGLIGVSATGGYFWGSGADATGAQDAGFSRISPNLIGVGGGGGGDFTGSIKLTTLNAVSGIQINGAAASGHYLRGNGTIFVSSALTATAGTSANTVKPGGVLFDHYADVSTTSTNGTEDDLYSDSVPANALDTNGAKLRSIAYVNTVGSATAARRIKSYFGGTLIFDSGSLTLSLGGDFRIQTDIIRESSTVVRAVVSVITTSASTVPYVSYTRITGLTLSNANILKTTGIASGTGALSGDIAAKIGFTEYLPAQ